MAIPFMPILLGIIVSIVTFIFVLRPPKKINNYYGYRTPQAMRDQKSWDFAQRFGARLMFALVACSTVICGIVYFAVNHRGVKIENPVIEWIYCALPAFAALISIVITEIALALKKKQ